MHYKLQCENLTAQILASNQAAVQKEKSLKALHEREISVYEQKLVELGTAIDAIDAERDGLLKRADALQKRIDSLSSGECQERSRQLVADIKRGAEVAAKCAAELDGKQQALTTCVRMYEDVKSVYDPAQ